MDVNNTTKLGKVKIVLLKGEKGDQGEAGISGDYAGLINKPAINSVTLDGELTSDDLGLATATEMESAMSSIYDMGQTIGNDILPTLTKLERMFKSPTANHKEGTVSNVRYIASWWRFGRLVLLHFAVIPTASLSGDTSLGRIAIPYNSMGTTFFSIGNGSAVRSACLATGAVAGTNQINLEGSFTSGTSYSGSVVYLTSDN